MAPPHNNPQEYTSIPDVEESVASNKTTEITTEDQKSTLRDDTYNLSFAFSLLSGTVWFSMFLWGLWIASFYSMAVAMRDWDQLNIIFPDLWVEGFPIANTAILLHLLGAIVMSLAGAFQLVKYIRKHYTIFHRWVGRLYIMASMVASIGGVVFIVNKGSYGGRQADVAFGVYGVYFCVCGICCYYYARQKDFTTHKLWAWRLYAMSLASWLYRADYYYWMLLFGHKGFTWLHNEEDRGWFDFFVNWGFYVPNIVVVEIIFRWGENAHLPNAWARALNVLYYVLWMMAVLFTVHAASQLWIPSVFGGYDLENAWILRQ